MEAERKGLRLERFLALVLVGVFLAILLWDSFAFAQGEGSKSVASVFSGWAQSYPAGACFLGLVVGTLLYPVGGRLAGRAARPVESAKQQQEVIPPAPKTPSSQF